jgi:hypothetical protein
MKKRKLSKEARAEAMKEAKRVVDILNEERHPLDPLKDLRLDPLKDITNNPTPRPPNIAIIDQEDRTQNVLDWLKNLISPSQLPSIPSLEELQQQVIKEHGLDDHEVCIELNIRFSEQAYADAHKPGGLYEQFQNKGYRWSSDADKWFNMNKIMQAEHAVMVRILVG